MYKKLIDLQTQLQAERQSLANELQTLQTFTDLAGPPPFDELQAAKRITAAKSADHLEGTTTAETIIATIDKERSESAKQLATFTKKKAEAQQKQAVQQAQLAAIDNEMASVGWKIKDFIKQEAQERLKATADAYRKAAVNLLNALIDIDALNAIIADNPNESPAKQVLLVKSLPKVGIESHEEVEPWLILQNGEKLIFTNDAALPVVHQRQQAITQEIEDALNG